MIAIMAGRSPRFLEGRAHRIVMGLLGTMLVFFALLLFRQACRYLS